jgi:hypothetical protein
MQIAVEKAEFVELIKKAVREVIREEEFALFLSRIPEVSDDEFAEILSVGEIPGPDDVVFEETVKL